MSVDVGYQALAASSRAHAAASETLGEEHPTSGALLLFYAVECALKNEVIRRHGLRGTADLGTEHKNHDLRGLAKELRLPPDLCPPDTCRVHGTQSGPASIPMARLHEAWRYGMRLDASSQREIIKTLKSLVRWSKSGSTKK